MYSNIILICLCKALVYFKYFTGSFYFWWFGTVICKEKKINVYWISCTTRRPILTFYTIRQLTFCIENFITFLNHIFFSTEPIQALNTFKTCYLYWHRISMYILQFAANFESALSKTRRPCVICTNIDPRVPLLL